MATIEIEDHVLRTLRTLPPEKRQRALEFVESLANASGASHKSSRGLWADLDIAVTDADIAAVRQEMWTDFPREIEL